MIAVLWNKVTKYRLRKSANGSLPRRIACFDCGLSHELPRDLKQAMASAEGFCDRHQGHTVNWFEQPGYAGLYTPNADVKQALQAAQSLTVTNLHSLASSTTAGWQSGVVDNTSNLYLDALVTPNLAFANTAAANSKACFLYAYGGLESGTYSYPCSGTEGTLTLSDITANPTNVRRIGTVAYLVQNATIAAGPFPVSTAFGNMLPPYWGVAVMNQSGAALQGSGSTVKYRGTYLTVI